MYDTILSIPGMNENVKIDIRISRKNVLLLNSVIKRGLSAKDDDRSPSLLTSIQKKHYKSWMLLQMTVEQKPVLTTLVKSLKR